MIRESSRQGGLALTLATPPRSGVDPARQSDASRVQDRRRTDGSESASAAERPGGESFGERIAEARRTAERESARRVQARVQQAAGDRSFRTDRALGIDRAFGTDRSAPTVRAGRTDRSERSESSERETAAGRPDGAEIRQTSDPDRQDERDAAAHASAAASVGAAPQTVTQAATQAAARVPGWLSGPVAGAAGAATAATAAAARTDEAGIGAHAVEDLHASASIHAGASANDSASARASTGAGAGDGNTGSGALAGGGATADTGDSTSAAATPRDGDPGIFGARDGLFGLDRTDFASRLAQAAGNAVTGADGLAAPSAALATAPGEDASVAGSKSLHIAGIATPFADPAFPGHLAGETLKLAIAGVERAEISLQPKDLGPIRIELSLNGESARIAFAATQPDTRHAIEQSLPILQDMLAEHGLMLADANVSDQRGGDAANRNHGNHAEPATGFDGESRRDADRGSARLGGAGSPVSEGAAAGPAIRRGLVDLYA